MSDGKERESRRPVSIMLSGSNGFMGQTMIQLSQTMPNIEIVAHFDKDHGFTQHPLGDVLVDFSHFSRAPAIIDFAVRHRLPLVLGTTALSPETEVALAEAAKTIAVCQASNFSLGAWVLAHIARVAAERLSSFRVDIEEVHHVHKKDAPSGTALMLQASLQEAGLPPVSVTSVREGEVIGTHKINLVGEEEKLSLVHEVTDRAVFARGALIAAERLLGKPPGLHPVSELFGLPQS